MDNALNSKPIPGFREAAEAALELVSESDAADAYAISFYIFDDEDDPRRPTLTIGFNTRTRWHRSIGEASSPTEAEWNFAFWLQNELVTLGGASSQSALAVATWIEELGLAYTDAEEESQFERCINLGAQITSNFVDAACALARSLHSDSIVVRVFGEPIPIIVHELEYYEQIADQTEACNPPGLAAGFVTWVRNGCV